MDYASIWSFPADFAKAKATAARAVDAEVARAGKLTHSTA
jgi:hypothetical protein